MIIRNLEAKLDAAEERVKSVEMSANAAKDAEAKVLSRIRVLEVERATMEAELQRAWTSAYTEAEGAADSLRADLRTTKSDHANAVRTLAALKEKALRMEQTMESYRTQIAEMTSQLESGAAEKGQLLKQLEATSKSLKQTKQRLEMATTLGQQLRNTHAEALAEWRQSELRLVERLKELERIEATLTKDLEVARVKADAEVEKRQAAETSGQRASAEVDNLTRKIAAMSVDLYDKGGDANSGTTNFSETIKNQIFELKRVSEQLELEVKEWKQRCHEQEEMVSSLKVINTDACAEIRQLQADRDRLKALQPKDAQPPQRRGPVGNGDASEQDQDVSQQLVAAKLQQQKLSSEVYWLKQMVARTAKQLKAEQEKSAEFETRLKALTGS
eukprot:c9837_g1_i1.p1 GENE.c9837_g1_i1~~c9837_g1_i1.p1  ORF type:complete len:388 (+),score=101.30 c9837_g1_i1:381-1544(+)